MGRVATAVRAFVKCLFNGDVASRVDVALTGVALPAPAAPAAAPSPVVPKPAPTPKPPAQSEAITLLAALQREARLVDFLQEDLTAYADEQIGAAVREVQRDSQQALQRYFDLRPVLVADEGAAVELPQPADAGRYRLTGKVSGAAPARGVLQHHGWEAAKCDLPKYTGSPDAAKIIAPAELEIE